MKKLIALMLVVSMSVSLLAACSNNSANNDSTTVAESTTEMSATESTTKEEVSDTDGFKANKTGDYPYVFRTTSGKTKTMNPHTYQTDAEGAMIGTVFGNLLDLAIDPNTKKMRFLPNDAAELPTRNEDGTVWTFKLRDDLKWSDNSTYDAYDYEYSWRMLLDPRMKNPRALEGFFGAVTVVGAEKYFFGGMTGEEYEALGENAPSADKLTQEELDKLWSEVGFKFPDKNTIEITLAYPVSEVDFLIKFTGASQTSVVDKELYEKGMNPERTATDYGTAIDKTKYNGTFYLAEWNVDQNLVYKKNTNSPLSDVFTIDEIRVRVVEDANTAVQMFENGDIDVVNLAAANYEKFKEDPRLVYGKSPQVWSMYVNMASETKPYLQDVNFRKALYFGLDRETIAKDILKTSVPASYIVPSARLAKPLEGISYRESDVAQALLPENNGYDVEKAKEYFAKAYEKYAQPMTFEIQYFDNSENMKKIAELLEKNYEEMFGKDKLDVQLRAVPWQSAYENMMAKNYDAAFGAWVGLEFNPWQGMEAHTSFAPTKIDQYHNEEFDNLYKRTMQGDLLFKEDERLEALAEMEKMLLDDLPIIPMYEPRPVTIISDRIDLITEGEYVPGIGYGEGQSEFSKLD